MSNTLLLGLHGIIYGSVIISSGEGEREREKMSQRVLVLIKAKMEKILDAAQNKLSIVDLWDVNDRLNNILRYISCDQDDLSGDTTVPYLVSEDEEENKSGDSDKENKRWNN